ncbi:MAG: non-heme iron oxygenase ferredoxin subunit [Alphaproteobacteria bacterium]
MSDEQAWTPVARVGDVPENDAIEVIVDGRCLAVFNLGGRICATAGICTHAHARLAEGYLDGEIVECPLHQGLFHVPTGKAVGAPATRDLETFAVRITDGKILVRLAG